MITIYILIPFIIIPQLLFSGVLVKYDKLHINSRASNEYVPFIGEMMPARWSFEALAVEQFKNNRYEKLFFPYDMEISLNDYIVGYLIPKLEKNLWQFQRARTLEDATRNNFEIINYHIGQISHEAGFAMPWRSYRIT